MQTKTIEELIETQIKCQHVQVDSEDLRHYTAVIVSDDFQGKPKIQRHRLVYGALGDYMHAEIHAFSFQAYTPEEYSNLKK